MKLKTYLANHGITQQEFAQMLNPPTSQVRISNWMVGRVRVPLADAIQIQRLTDGEVAVEDWLDDENNDDTADDQKAVA